MRSYSLEQWNVFQKKFPSGFPRCEAATAGEGSKGRGGCEKVFGKPCRAFCPTPCCPQQLTLPSCYFSFCDHFPGWEKIQLNQHGDSSESSKSTSIPVSLLLIQWTGCQLLWAFQAFAVGNFYGSSAPLQCDNQANQPSWGPASPVHHRFYFAKCYLQ